MEHQKDLPAHTATPTSDGTKVVFDAPVARQSYVTRMFLDKYNCVEFNWDSCTTVILYNTPENPEDYD